MYSGEVNDKEQPHGEGKLVNDDGSTQYGTWLNGKLNGFCVFSYQEGDRWEGERSDGKPHGKQTIYT